MEEAVFQIIRSGACLMAQCIKPLAFSVLDNLSSVPGHTGRRERTASHKMVFDLHMSGCARTTLHTNIIRYIFRKVLGDVTVL